MTTFRILPSIAASGILLAALTACASGPADGDAAPVPDAGETLGDCMIGDWKADTADLAEQLQAYFAENGIPATDSSAEGPSRVSITADTMTYEIDLTMMVDAQDAGGPRIQVIQTHSGSGTGTWAIEDGKVVFGDFDDGIEIRTTVVVDGTAADTPVQSPGGGGGGVPMTVTCAGDVMTTAPDVSPFTTIWHREDR